MNLEKIIIILAANNPSYAEKLIHDCCTSLHNSAFSQSKSNKDVITFGKVDKADLQLTTCDFDKDAEAMVLSDVGTYYLDFRGEQVYQEFQRHVRIKILKEKGLDRADIKIRYLHGTNSENITSLSANTFNLDEQGNIVVTKLDKKLVYDKKNEFPLFPANLHVP